MEAELTQLLEKKRSRGRWKLSDAKSRFSEVVKLAQNHPQRVTVDGEDAVVIVAAATYDREHAHRTGEELIRAFQRPIAAELDLERRPIAASVRDVDL